MQLKPLARLASPSLILVTLMVGACSSSDAVTPGSPDQGTTASDDGDVSPRIDASSLADKPLTELLAEVPADVTWAKLDLSIKTALELKAKRELASHRADWGATGLKRKLDLMLDAPTDQMLDSFNTYVRGAFAAQVPNDFSATAGVSNGPLLAALKRLFIVSMASSRASLVVDRKLENLEWDGSGPIDGFPLPDAETLTAQRDMAASLVGDLRKITGDSLTPIEGQLHARALYYARSYAHGSRAFLGKGGHDLQTPYALPFYARALARAFAIDNGSMFDKRVDRLLEQANALWMGSLRWVNVGTVDSTINASIPTAIKADAIEQQLGDPGSAAVFLRLIDWWKERLETHPDARRRCTIYNAASKKAIWDAFSADARFDNEGKGSLAGYRAELTTLLRTITDGARSAARAIVENDATLDAAQVKQVAAALDGETRLGAMRATLYAALDKATGNSKASDRIKQSSDELTMIGGSKEKLDQAQQAQLLKMWQRVRASLHRRYGGPGFDVSAMLPASITINTGSAQSTTPDGEIIIGTANKRSIAVYLDTLVHEAHHALAYKLGRVGQSSQGPMFEAAATHAGRQLLDEMLRETYPGDPMRVGLYLLDYYISGSTTLLGRTAATLAIYDRTSCEANEPNSIEWAEQAAAARGIADSALTAASWRAHRGTQYLQYAWGRTHFATLVAELEKAVEPGVDNGIDPFVLLKCNMPYPDATSASADKLRRCLE